MIELIIAILTLIAAAVDRIGSLMVPESVKVKPERAKSEGL